MPCCWSQNDRDWLMASIETRGRMGYLPAAKYWKLSAKQKNLWQQHVKENNEKSLLHQVAELSTVVDELPGARDKKRAPVLLVVVLQWLAPSLGLPCTISKQLVVTIKLWLSLQSVNCEISLHSDSQFSQYPVAEDRPTDSMELIFQSSIVPSCNHCYCCYHNHLSHHRPNHHSNLDSNADFWSPTNPYPPVNEATMVLGYELMMHHTCLQALWLYLFTLVPFEWDIPNGQQLLLQLEGVTIFCESQADPWGIGLFMTGLTSYRSRIRDQMLLLRMGLPLPWAPFLSSHLRHWLQYWLLIIWWA